MKEDEVLLNTVETAFDSEHRINKQIDLKSELEEFYLQRPNNDFLWIPKEWFYYRRLAKGDSSVIKEPKTLAEKPALYDSMLTKETAERMQNYLRNKKGYYEAEVDYIYCACDDKATVSYIVDPKQQYNINTLTYLCLDSMIQKEVNILQQNSFLAQGDPLDALTFDLEKQRIVNFMQEEGYANFNFNHVGIKGDSTGLDHAWDVFIEIRPPSDTLSHRKFRIGKLDIYTDYHQFQKPEMLQSKQVFGNTYYHQSKEFIVRPSTLNRKIFLSPYDYYNTSNYDKTVRKLFGLNTYRFVKVSPYLDTPNDSLINYRIFLTPHNSRWVFDVGTDIFFSNISRVDRNLIGLAIGAGFENRNAFGGSEKYKLSLESGIEFDAQTQEINTLTLGLNNTLDIPNFSKPLNAMLFANKLGIIKDKAIGHLKDEASTQIDLGLNFIDIINIYRLSSINATYGYDITFNNKHRLIFNQIGFQYTDYIIRDSFDIIISQNPLQERSFQTTLFTGLLFKDLSYFYQSDNGFYNKNYAFIAYLETSGLEVHLFNKTANLFSNSDPIWRLSNNVAFEKFVKLELDGRWSKRYKNDTQLAGRLKMGVSVPFGKANQTEDNVVSFIKQFLIGGPGGLRAWRPMQLGPGGYIFPDPNPISFYQRGDLLLEFNLEYRFDLFWLLEGALFFDGGNIWTLKEDPDRIDAKISSKFYDQIALGYGWGLRFDFNYFLIRFDFGYKLRYPYEIPGTNSHYTSLSGQGLLGNFNVAVNYPF